MGGTSETTASVVNQATVNAALKVFQKCDASASNESDVTVDTKGKGCNIDDSSDTEQDASATVTSCDISADLDATLKAEMAASMDQAAKTVGNSIFSGDMSIFTSSKDKSNVTNSSIMNADMSSVSSCLAAANNKKKATYLAQDSCDITLRNKIKQNATADLQKCVLAAINAAGASDTSNTDTKQNATTEGMLASLFSGFNGIAMAMIIAFGCAMIAAVIYAVIRAKHKKAASATAAQFATILTDYGRFQ